MQKLYELDSYVSLAGISHTYVYSDPNYGGYIFNDKSQIIQYYDSD